MAAIEPTLQMWLVFGFIAVAVVAYATERFSIEMVSLCVVAFLSALFFHMPQVAQPGLPEITTTTLLAGLADPALISVLALMVVGQGIVRTGALDGPARRMVSLRRKHPFLAVAAALTAVMALSGFLNNTPVVVIFIPIMVVIADRMRRSASGLMIPLSYAAILGGMTTVIGSSTNLLVSAAAVRSGQPKIEFFDITAIGIVLAGVGMIYVIFVAPRLLPDRATLAQSLTHGVEGRQFIAQIDVREGSSLVGEKPRAGLFPSMPGITVRLIQRREEQVLPPFDEIELQVGDELIIAATRKSITEAMARTPDLLQAMHASDDLPPPEGDDAPMDRDFLLAEVIVAPASRMIGRNLAQIVFHTRTRCTVLGIQRRSRMIRQGLNDIRLEAGDVLLTLGHRSDVHRLRFNRDVILQEWSAYDLPARELAKRAALIFGAVVATAASGILPIVVAALGGAVLMLATGCLNIHQATRALDRRVAVLVWAALAMGTALHGTGGADYVAQQLMAALDGAPPLVILSSFFLLVACFTNVLSNNATAVLFTPIGIGLAGQLGVPPVAFVYATLFGANCSFATPMGYQTNLLVMGPGHYRFSDYLKAGLPLLVLIWLTFTCVAALTFDL